MSVDGLIMGARIDDDTGLELRPFDVALGDAILEKVYVAPDLLLTRNKIRALNISERGFDIDLRERLGDVGQGLRYKAAISNVGEQHMPGVGKQRAYSLLAHADLKKYPHFLVWYPGFAHTFMSRGTRWEMALQAQIARALGVNILCVNPGGRAVPGHAESRGVGNVSARALVKDTLHSTEKILLEILDAAGVSGEMSSDVIVSGHSLGAYLARAFAHELAIREGRFVLRGIVQEAPIGAGTGEDLLFKNHWKSIFRHLPESLVRGFVPFSRGMDFRVRHLIKLFYGEDSTLANALLAAWALAPGESRNFLDISLFPGDLEAFITTMDTCSDQILTGRRGVGSSILFPTDDAVFHRGPLEGQDPQDHMWRQTEDAGTEAISFEGPHCFVTPDPHQYQRIAVRDAYRQAYNLPQLELV